LKTLSAYAAKKLLRSINMGIWNDSSEQEKYFRRKRYQEFGGDPGFDAFIGAIPSLLKIAPFILIPLAIIYFVKLYWMYVVSVVIAGICIFICKKIYQIVKRPGLKILITILVSIALIVVLLIAAPPGNSKARISPVSDQASATQSTHTRYMFVNSDSLNVRSGPSADYGVVGQLKKNTRVQIINSSGQWWKIKSGNIEGYVNSNFLINEIKTPSTSNSLKFVSTSILAENKSGNISGRTTRDKSFQDDYERAVCEYDQRMMVLPPGLVLPGGDTVQERVHRINIGAIEPDK